MEQRKGDVIPCFSISNRASFSPGCLWRGTPHVRRTLRREGERRGEEGRKGRANQDRISVDWKGGGRTTVD